MLNFAPHSTTFSTACWRQDAARIVEQLFTVTPPSAWNALLDLRRGLLHSNDWNATLNTFLACRERLEADHYLPFYRLRRLLAASLRLEIGAETVSVPVSSLAELLRSRHRSFAGMKRAVHRHLFEHAINLPSPEQFSLRLIERT